MKIQLTQKDIKELRYQCRMGYIIPFMFFIIGTVISVSIYEFNFNSESDGLNIEMAAFITLWIFVLAFFIGYKMIGKYIKDIRNNKKIQELRKIQKKESKKDYEAGSGTLYLGQKMNGFDSFSIVVDNYRYRVNKDFFRNCNEGEDVIFNFAPKSRYLISIELQKQAQKKPAFAG